MNSDQPKTFHGQPATGSPVSETATNVILWNRMRQNDQEALVALYEHLYLQLVNYGIRSSSDVELTRDAINDMFLEIWDQRQKLPEVSNVRSYLFTYLRRKIFAGIRQTKKSLLAAIIFSDAVSPHELSYEECIVAVQATEEIRQKIKRAISRLTPRQKELIQLRYFDGLSIEEVSKRAGITTKTAYNILGFAIKTLSVEFIIWVVVYLF
jgi:RNA polymerase sigma factor (sigma-70 family)